MKVPQAAINRAAAMALSLGLGAAVITTPATAWATPSHSESSTSPSDSRSSSKHSPPNGPSSPSRSDADGDAANTDVRTVGADRDDALDSEATDSPPQATEAGGEQSASTGGDAVTNEKTSTSGEAGAGENAEESVTHDLSSDPAADEANEASQPEAPTAGTDSDPSREVAAVERATPAPRPSVSASADIRETPAVTGASQSSQEVGAALSGDALIAAVDSGAVNSASRLATPLATETTKTIPPFVSAVRAFVYSLFPSPDTTPESPILLTLLAWARRQIHLAFVNEAPTANPEMVVEYRSGVVEGTLGATDPNGDRLIYEVVNAPETGQAIVTDDGTYYYQLDPGAEDGTDTFVVRITDSGWRPFGSRKSIDVPVVVTVVDPDTVNTLSTKGFKVWNLSSQPLVYNGYTGTSPEKGGPPIGSVVGIGQFLDFELPVQWLWNSDTTAKFTAADGSTIEANMDVSPVSRTVASCSLKGRGVCTPNGLTENVTTITYMDPANTTVNLDDSEAQKQSAVLSALCYSGANANCTLKVTAQTNELTSEHVVTQGGIVINETSQEIVRTVGTKDIVTQSSSVTVTGKASTKVADLVNLEVTQAYGHSWTGTHEFDQTLQVKVASYTESIILAEQPVYRVTGDFTLRMGNTTWNLKNVYFESVRTSGDPVGIIRFREVKLPVPAEGDLPMDAGVFAAPQ